MLLFISITLTVFVMIISSYGVFLCVKTIRQTPKLKIITALLILIFVIGICIISLLNLPSLYKKKEPEIHEDVFESAKAFVLGRILAETLPGRKALIITGWDSNNEDIIQKQITSLENGLSPEITVAAVERVKIKLIKQIDKRVIEDDAVEKFNEVINVHPECEIIISMVGLPQDFESLDIYELDDNSRPVLALLDGLIFSLEEAIRDGFISIAVAYRPGWTLYPDLPDDPKKLFNMRYLAITPKNVDEMKKYHPGLFWGRRRR